MTSPSLFDQPQPENERSNPMNALIPIDNNAQGEPTVNARDLHEFLESKRQCQPRFRFDLSLIHI